jgi:hypothetical protein
MYFYTHDLNLNPTRVEPSLDAGFIFHLRMHVKLEKKLKPKKILKNPETQKKPEKNSKPERNPKKSERNIFTKPDGHPNLTRNPTGLGSGAKFHPRVRVSNSIRLHFFTGLFFG